MKDLKVFSSSEFGELVVLIIDGKEWFPSKQCAKALGYKDTTIEQLDDDLKEQVHTMMASGAYSSEKISDFPVRHGVKISQASVCKYKRNNFRIVRWKGCTDQCPKLKYQ